jgi:hypothetical protein
VRQLSDLCPASLSPAPTNLDIPPGFYEQLYRELEAIQSAYASGATVTVTVGVTADTWAQAIYNLPLAVKFFAKRGYRIIGSSVSRGAVSGRPVMFVNMRPE